MTRRAPLLSCVMLSCTWPLGLCGPEASEEKMEQMAKGIWLILVPQYKPSSLAAETPGQALGAHRGEPELGSWLWLLILASF